MQTLPQQIETMATSGATQVTLKYQAGKAQLMPETKTDRQSEHHDNSRQTNAT